MFSWSNFSVSSYATSCPGPAVGAGGSLVVNLDITIVNVALASLVRELYAP
jgi:hypothetical protein